MGKKLMVVAHPDDEVIFGGQELLKSRDWLVVCLTGATNRARTLEFIASCNNLGVDYRICTFPDSWEGFTPQKLCAVNDYLYGIMRVHKFDCVVTHNADGEYGHKQHKQVHEVVAKLAKELRIPMYVFSLGKELNAEMAEKKVKALSVYANESVGMTEVQDYIMYGSITPYKSKGYDWSEIYDDLILPLNAKERVISGFGISPKEDWVANMKELSDKGFIFGQCEDGKLVGLCYLRETTLDERSYTTTVIVHKGYRGRGIATRLKERVIEFAFNELDAKSVFDVIDSENVSSIKTSLNCDMRVVSVGQLRRGGSTKVIMRRDNPKWR